MSAFEAFVIGVVCGALLVVGAFVLALVYFAGEGC